MSIAQEAEMVDPYPAALLVVVCSTGKFSFLHYFPNHGQLFPAYARVTWDLLSPRDSCPFRKLHSVDQ